MSPLRVLLLSTDLERGGLPLRVTYIAKQLAKIGIEPIVGCLSAPGPLSEDLDRAGVETFSCNAGSALDFMVIRRFANHVRRINPDIIHSFLFHANMVARLAGRWDRPRPIITSTVTIEIERRWHRWLESLTCGLSDLHLANSEAVAAHLRDELGFPQDRIAVIRNAIDLERLDATPPADRATLGIEQGVPLIVWAGRIDPVKNLETFVNVIARLKQRRPVRGLIIGQGPDRRRIQRLIDQNNLTDVILMPGWSESVAGWLKSADVLLFPSRTEGSPNVVLEAMACRCPVVASDIPPIAELIATDVSGVLRASSDEAGFVHAIELILDDGGLRSRLVKSARTNIEQRHQLPVILNAWRELYAGAVGESRPITASPQIF